MAFAYSPTVCQSTRIYEFRRSPSTCLSEPVWVPEVQIWVRCGSCGPVGETRPIQRVEMTTIYVSDELEELYK